MVLVRAFAALGMVTVRIPLTKRAVALSESTEIGNTYTRENEPQ